MKVKSSVPLRNECSEMQDKDPSVEEADSQESPKDAKFAFKRMKQPKKEKEKASDPSRFNGEGVIFKSKLIGVEAVPDARGDKMCQEAMHKLKLNVRSTGPHKRKIHVCISFQGIKIKDEKNGATIYHHPVALISFISQEISDARAFGYVFGSSDGPHNFIAIKTEKPAFHVVLALRELFQTVMNHKQEQIEIVKESKSELEGEKSLEAKDTNSSGSSSKNEDPFMPKEENIYFEVLLTEPLKMVEEVAPISETRAEPTRTIDELLGLQNELNQLQQGIEQMDSIATAAVLNQGAAPQENDPFDTSFVLGPKRDSIPLPMPTPISAPFPRTEDQYFSNEDRYAVFNAVDTKPSIFEAPTPYIPDLKDLEEEIVRKTPPPPKPPRNAKASSPDQSVFADLDPLGKDRPYKNKAEFFQDVKNPPKKVLNDLVDKNEHSSFVNSSVLSSSLPNSFNPKLSVVPPNGNPFERSETAFLPSRGSEPAFSIAGSPPSNFPSQNGNHYLGMSPPGSTILMNRAASSAPIPIPPRNGMFLNGSPDSKSPTTNGSGSPADDYCYLAHNENGSTPSAKNCTSSVSRPRPRASSGPAPIPGPPRTIDSEIMNRANLKSITNVLLTNGHKIRAQSLTLESQKQNIFAKKNDPFADEFFFSLPKKATNHIGRKEIPDYV